MTHKTKTIIVCSTLIALIISVTLAVTFYVQLRSCFMDGYEEGQMDTQEEISWSILEAREALENTKDNLITGFDSAQKSLDEIDLWEDPERWQ